MSVGWLWGCRPIILMPDVGVSARIDTGEKSLCAFKVGRLERMASEIIDIILESKEVFRQGDSRQYISLSIECRLLVISPLNFDFGCIKCAMLIDTLP